MARFFNKRTNNNKIKRLHSQITLQSHNNVYKEKNIVNEIKIVETVDLPNLPLEEVQVIPEIEEDIIEIEEKNTEIEDNSEELSVTSLKNKKRKKKVYDDDNK